MREKLKDPEVAKDKTKEEKTKKDLQELEKKVLSIQDNVLIQDMLSVIWGAAYHVSSLGDAVAFAYGHRWTLDWVAWFLALAEVTSHQGLYGSWKTWKVMEF